MSRLISIELLILIAVWRAVSQQELIVNQISQQAVSQAAKQIGEQIGLALLDSLLQKGQEEVARQALQRQIELLEDINPPYAKLLKQIPPETIVSAALLQRQQLNGPAEDTGNPLLNVLAKNGIVAQGVTPGQHNATQQIGNVFQAVLRNILQSVQPSVVQNSLIAPQVPQQEITNPLAPNANQLVIPQQTGGLLGAFAQASSAGKGLGAFGKSLGAFPPGLGSGSINGFPGFNSIGQAPGLGSAITAPIAIPTALGSIPTALGGLSHPDSGFPSAGKSFKAVSPQAGPPPDPFGASAGKNLGPPPDEFMFTTPLSPFVTDGTSIAEVTTKRKNAERKTNSKEKSPTSREKDHHSSDRREVSLRTLQEKQKTGHTDVLDTSSAASEAASEPPASPGTETTAEIEQSQQIEITTEISAAETTYLPPRKSTENALTRDQRRLNEINARMHRVLASRKSQRGDDDRKEFLSKFRKPVPEVDKEVDLQTIDSVVEAFVGSSPRLIRDAAIFNVDQAPVQLRAFQDERFHFLNGRTGFGTTNERGGAWQPSKSGFSSPLATGVGRAVDQGAHVQGNVQLPKKWIEGRTFSLDGSLNRNNNNDLFSGVELLRWNQ